MMRNSVLWVIVCVVIVHGEPQQQLQPLQPHQQQLQPNQPHQQPLQSFQQPLQPPPSGYENNFNPNVGVTNYAQTPGPEENQVNYPNFQQQQIPPSQPAEQSAGPEPEVHRPRGHKSYENTEEFPTAEEDDELISEAIPGQPDDDYPVFDGIPKTSFTCSDKTFPGYFADVEARCQVFHICEVGGAKHSFLCPSGSVFNQKYLVCDWWYDFVCENVQELFADQQELDRQTQEREFPAAATGAGEIPASSPGPQDVQYQQQQQQPQQQQQQQQLNQQPEYTPSGQDQNVNNYGFPDNGFNFQGNNNGYFPPNDIFHGAETGVPNRNRNYENENQGNEYANRGPENGNTNNENANNESNNKQNEQHVEQSNELKTKINENRTMVNENNSAAYVAPKKDIGPDARHRQNVRISRRGNQFPGQVKPTEQTLKPSENPLQRPNVAQTRAPDTTPNRFSGNQYISSTPETLNKELEQELIKNNQEANNNQAFSAPAFNNPNYQTPVPLNN